MAKKDSQKRGAFQIEENEVYEWIIASRERGTYQNNNQGILPIVFLLKLCVGFIITGILIRQEMIRHVNPTNNPAIKFQASNGWLIRFLHRFNLVVRRISGSGREFPKDCHKEISDYLKSANRLMKGYASNAIISFDETSIYADMLGNYTYEKRGKTKVAALSSGHEKVRLSCLMVYAVW